MRVRTAAVAAMLAAGTLGTGVASAAPAHVIVPERFVVGSNIQYHVGSALQELNDEIAQGPGKKYVAKDAATITVDNSIVLVTVGTDGKVRIVTDRYYGSQIYGDDGTIEPTPVAKDDSSS